MFKIRNIFKKGNRRRSFDNLHTTMNTFPESRKSYGHNSIALEKLPINNYPGIQFRLPCTPPPGLFFIGAKLFIGTLWMGMKVSSKNFWFGLFEIAWFLWQPIANLRRGVCLQNYSYLSYNLS